MYALTGPRLQPAVGPQLLPSAITTTSGHHAVQRCNVVPHTSLALIDHHSDALSQPLSGTSADFDDAIMESMDMDLFEPDDPPPSLFSQSNQHRSSNRLLSSSAMACLAHGFSRLPDESGNSIRARGAAAGGGGGAGSTTNPHTASAALAEVLRGGSTAGGVGGVQQGPTMSGAALHASVVCLEALTLKPAGCTHDGAVSTPQSTTVQQSGPTSGARPLSHFTDLCSENSMTGASAVVSYVASATGVLRRCDDTPRICDRPKSHSVQLADTSHPYSLHAAAGSQQYSPSALSTSTLINVGPGGSGGGGPGDSAIGVGVVGGSGPSGAGSACSASSSVHPALARVLASAVAAAHSGESGSSGSGGSNTARVPRSDLNLPFATSDAGGYPVAGTTDGGLSAFTTAAASAALVPARMQVGWGLGATVLGGGSGPLPAAVQPKTMCHASSGGTGGSIAAAAFRSIGVVSSQPNVAVPGPPAATNNLSLINNTRDSVSNSSTLAGAACGYGMQCHVTAQRPYSEPWSGMRGGGGDGTHLYDRLPDVGAPVGDTADAVTAAVRAVLRGNDACMELPGMAYGSDMLPRQPAMEYGMYGCTTGAPRSGYPNVVELPHPSAPMLPPPSPPSWAVPAEASHPTQLPQPFPQPPQPLPAAGLDSLKSSGVPAVDRYLQQLLQDTAGERHMFLCKQPLGPSACQAVASCLRVSGGIKSITLSYCGITCEGLAALAEGLRTCHHVLVLDLSYNNIADASIASLTAVLPHMAQLATLILDGNLQLGDAAVSALAPTARSCSCLRRVSMRGTAASALGLKELAAAQASNARRMARRGVAGLSAVSGERPVTWDGVTTAAAANGASGGGAAGGTFIAQLCSLLRTLVRPALAAEQAVAEAVGGLMAAAPGLQPPPVGDSSAVGGSSPVGFSINTSRLLSYLADGLRDRGYEVAVTQALGGGPGGECLRNLRHTFLSVTCPRPTGADAAASGPPSPAAAAVAAAASLAGSLAGPRRANGAGSSPPLPYHAGVIIVDPELKEQFEVAMPTPRYEALVAALPRVYVGAEERLPLVVEVLCDEMALALRTKGLVIPPWRESAAMISKWQPKQSKMLVPGYGSNTSINTLPRATDAAAGVVSDSGSDPSSDNITPRVSLADGMGVATAAAVVPVTVHWRCDSIAPGTGGGGAGGGGVFQIGGDNGREGKNWTRNSTGMVPAAAVAGAGVDSEPSMGPAPSFGLQQGTAEGGRRDTTHADNNSVGRQSFGFRRCTSEKGMLVSVGFLMRGDMAGAGAAAATTEVAVAALPARPVDGGHLGGAWGAVLAGAGSGNALMT